MKPGDIVFWNTEYHKGQFYIILRVMEHRNFKVFSSYNGTFFEDTVLLSYLNHISEGFWEWKN